MIKFLKKIKENWKEYLEKKTKEKERKKRLLRIKIAAYNLGSKNALKPKEIFWYITFPKIFKCSMFGVKYSIIGILIIGGIVVESIILLGSLIYGIFLYLILPIIILCIIL